MSTVNAATTSSSCALPKATIVGSNHRGSDRLTMVNASTSSSSFALRKVTIGDSNYLGNDVVFPSEGRAGANCLLGTKVMVPVDGPVREGVGLLGSPCFEIPRVVERDSRLAVTDEGQRQALLRKKDRKNLATMAMLLLSRWLYVACALVLIYLTLLAYPAHGVASVLAGVAAFGCFSLAFYTLVERASLGFGRLRPSVVSMYDDYFLYHERHWKLSGSP